MRQFDQQIKSNMRRFDYMQAVYTSYSPRRNSECLSRIDMVPPNIYPTNLTYVLSVCYQLLSWIPGILRPYMLSAIAAQCDPKQI